MGPKTKNVKTTNKGTNVETLNKGNGHVTPSPQVSSLIQSKTQVDKQNLNPPPPFTISTAIATVQSKLLFPKKPVKPAPAPPDTSHKESWLYKWLEETQPGFGDDYHKCLKDAGLEKRSDFLRPLPLDDGGLEKAGVGKLGDRRKLIVMIEKLGKELEGVREG